MAGREGVFKIIISGIIQTKFDVMGEHFILSNDIRADSYYVNEGFIDFHLNQLKYSFGIFNIKHEYRSFYSYDLVINGELPSLAKKSKLMNIERLRVITDEGIVKLSDVSLYNNEVVINLYYYNLLFSDKSSPITIDNIHQDEFDFNTVIALEYSDYRAITNPTYNKKIIIKGIVFDPDNEPLLDNIYQYDYNATNIMLSDSLFEEFTEFYYEPYKYMYNINNINVYSFFQNHYPVFNDDVSDDIIITELDSTFLEFIENIARLRNVIVAVSIVFTVFSIILIYYNTSSNIERSEKEVGILRSLGLSKFNIFQVFFHEILIISILLIPLAFLLINIFISSINTNIIFQNYQFRLLNLDIFSISIIIIFTMTILNVSIIIPLYNLLKKTPVEIIRLN